MSVRTRWPLYLLSLAFALLGARLAWTVTRSDLGWQPHVDQWTTVAASLVGIEVRSLSDKDPESQARFWLDQVAQIDSTELDPQVAIGAAWILDAPQMGFINRHIRLKDGPDYVGLPTSWRRELDYEAIGALTEEFESLCRDDCLAKVETAFRLDGANVELWRTRALLAFRLKSMSLDLEPRRDDWLSVLEESAKHDPGNALYDYLAAMQLWSSSAKYKYEEGGYVLKVKDRETFEQANARLAAALSKPHLKFGTEAFPATKAFLDESSTSRADHMTAIASRQIDARASALMFGIMGWQRRQNDIEQRQENFKAAIAAAKNVLRVSQQLTKSENNSDLTSTKLILRRSSLAILEDIHEHHPHRFDADEARKLSADYGQTELDLKIRGKVVERMIAKAGKDNSQTMVTVAIQTPAIAMLATALLIGLIALIWGKSSDERVEMGWLRHVAAWLVGIGVSFVFLGMCPAEIVSPAVQSWAVRGLIGFAFALPTLGLLSLLRRVFQMPWAQFAALAAVMTLLFVVTITVPIAAIVELDGPRHFAVSSFAQVHLVVAFASVLLFVGFCLTAVRFLLAFARSDSLSRRRKFLACCCLFLFAIITVPAGVMVATICVELEVKAWLSPTVWNEVAAVHISPVELQNAMQLKNGNWTWALVQWHAYHGLIATTSIAIGVLLIWHLMRRGHRFEGGCREILRSHRPSEIRQSGFAVARSCLAVSSLFLLVYLAYAPTVVDSMDTYHRVHYDRLVNPAQAWEEIDAATAQIKSSEPMMAELQLEIEEYNRTVAEAWQEE